MKTKELCLGATVVFPIGMTYPMSRYVSPGDKGVVIEAGISQYRVQLLKDGKIIWAPPKRLVLEEDYIPTKKAQCEECYHYKLPDHIDKSSGLCYGCLEEDDGIDDLWADWRQSRGV